MDEEIRELERKIRRDPDLCSELSIIRELIENLDLEGQEQAVAEAEAQLKRMKDTGTDQAIDMAERHLEEQKDILKQKRKAVRDLIDDSSTEVRRLSSKLDRIGIKSGMLSLISIYTDAGIGVIDAINNNDSLLGPIYRATLNGNCKRALALINKKTIGEHALDLKPITGASALAAEGILEWIFGLVREICSKLEEE